MQAKEVTKVATCMSIGSVRIWLVWRLLSNPLSQLWKLWRSLLASKFDALDVDLLKRLGRCIPPYEIGKVLWWVNKLQILQVACDLGVDEEGFLMRNHPGVDSDSRVFDTVLNLNSLVKEDSVRSWSYTPQTIRSNPVVHPATPLVRVQLLSTSSAACSQYRESANR